LDKPHTGGTLAQPSPRNQPLLTPEQLRSRLADFYRAVEQFNDGYYFESHETLEDLWLVTPWPERQLFQAVIQLAAAFVHVARGGLPGALKLLDAAAARLRDFAPQALGLDVAALLDDIARARAELMALGPGRLRDWDEARTPRLRVQPEAASPLPPTGGH
jgi:predicted metal-dependent hydrolase